MSKCSNCGKEIKEYGYKSIYPELENNEYCSEECIKIDHEEMRLKLIKKNTLDRWLKVKEAFFIATDYLEETDEEQYNLFKEDYPNIYDTIDILDKRIKKDYGEQNETNK